MSGTTVAISVRDPDSSPSGVGAWAARHSSSRAVVVSVIIAATLLGLALRVYQLTRPGHLQGVGDYDDGADFGSAILLAHGVLPYRDFVTVQPPGITVLMTPAALLSRLVGTARAIAAARILTVLAGAGAVVLGGLIVRHRGIFALVVTCGLIAIYPGSVQAAHTVLLEPWLVLFCLAGVTLAFDGDRPASGGKLTWSGAALGFAGAVKLWAIIPAAVILVVLLAKPRQSARYLVGVAIGFLIPVLPFAAMAPGRFYDSVVMAQLVRTSARTPLAYRLQQLTGLTWWHTANLPLSIVALALAVGVGGTLIATSLATGQRAPALECSAVAIAGLVFAAFLVPDDFYYHYSAFFGPFVAIAFALPFSRLIGDRGDGEENLQGGGPGLRQLRLRQPPPTWLKRAAVCAASLAIVGLPLAVPQAENSPTPTYRNVIGAVQRVIFPGACVASDEASLLISADRLVSSVPGCSAVVDGFGTSYALSGRSARAAGAIPAVARVWRRAFAAAQYVLLTRCNSLRIAWTPGLRAYLHRNFIRVSGPFAPVELYVRSHPP